MSYKKIVFFNKNVSAVCPELFGARVDLLEPGFYELPICSIRVLVRTTTDLACYLS